MSSILIYFPIKIRAVIPYKEAAGAVNALAKVSGGSIPSLPIPLLKEMDYTMNKYKIAIGWSVYDEIEVEADSFNDAIKKAEDFIVSEEPLPPNPEYEDGSAYVNTEMSKVFNDIED